MSVLCLATSHAAAPEPVPARLYFADAKISFGFPSNWTLETEFPYGPLFSKITQDGTRAQIVCAISEIIQSTRLSDDIPMGALKELAHQSLPTQEPTFQLVSETERRILSQNALEIIWESDRDNQRLRRKSIYFFVENRVYAIALETTPKSFDWVQLDFEGWLSSLSILKRKETGKLMVPSRGGLWIHQSAGAKISIPDDWLIGVAHESVLGAAYAPTDKEHSSFTVTVDPANRGTSIASSAKKELRRAIQRGGYDILEEREEAFHGYPALRILYEGKRNGHYMRASDVLIASPKARWLISWEADGPLFRQLQTQYDDILNAIQFF